MRKFARPIVNQETPLETVSRYEELQSRKQELEEKRIQLPDKYNLGWYSKVIERGDYLFLLVGGGVVATLYFKGSVIPGLIVVIAWAFVRMALEYVRSRRRSQCEAQREEIQASISEIDEEIESVRQRWKTERERKRRQRKRERQKKKKDWWLSLSPRQFEKEVGEIYESEGWNVRLTSESDDGGYDLKIRSEGKTCLVECKQRKPGSSVGRPTVQKLAGVVAGEKADRGVCVTTGGFTAKAEAFARKVDIGLVDGDELLKMVE